MCHQTSNQWNGYSCGKVLVSASLMGLLASLAPATAYCGDDHEAGSKATQPVKEEIELLAYTLRLDTADLPRELILWERKQDAIIARLIAATQITPENRYEEIVAATSARLLARFGSSRAIRALAMRISLQNHRYSKVIASTGPPKGYVSKYYPCVDALLSIDNRNTLPLIDASLSGRNKATIESELIAYTLLEIEGRWQEDRARLIELANAKAAEESQNAQIQHRRDMLVYFLTEIDPVFYRSPYAARERGESPPERSVLFGKDMSW